MFDTSTLQGGWYIAMGARAFKSGPIKEINDQVDEANLLELRAFDGYREIKWVRGDLGEAFQRRDSADIQFDKRRCETHYLDIDTKKTREYRERDEGGIEADEVLATGGGKYRLTESMPEKMVVQVYYRADDKGFYQPFDFRIVGWKEWN